MSYIIVPFSEERFKGLNALKTFCVLGMDFYMIAAFPVLMHGTWWIAYFIVGLSVPLLIDELYLIMKNICINQFNKRLKNKAKKSNR